MLGIRKQRVMNLDEGYSVSFILNSLRVYLSSEFSYASSFRSQRLRAEWNYRRSHYYCVWKFADGLLFTVLGFQLIKAAVKCCRQSFWNFWV